MECDRCHAIFTVFESEFMKEAKTDYCPFCGKKVR